MAKRRAMEWLPNHLFPWNLLGRQIIGTGAKDKLAMPQSAREHNWVLSHQLPPVTSSAPGEDSLWGVSLDTAVCRKLWICLQTVRIQRGKRNMEEKRLQGEPLSGPVTAVYFSIWPKPGVCSRTQSRHSGDKYCLGSDLSWSICTYLGRKSGRGREEPAGWQRNTLGMNWILILTPLQAVLPDGRKFERRQL